MWCKIKCKECDATYMNHTSRTLEARINKHKTRINWKTTQRLVIIEHWLKYSHDFDWSNIKIIDEDKILNKKLILKMIFIGNKQFKSIA